jgi:TatD DNase family protein
MPVVLHTRDAMQQSIDVIKEYAGKNLRGIFHCFSGTLQNALDVIDTGFYLGIGGVITYKNSGLAQVIKEIDLEHIVLETDAPYLTPVPFRGKRNESSYLKYIVQKIAEVKNISVEEVAITTTSNSKNIFR